MTPTASDALLLAEKAHRRQVDNPVSPTSNTLSPTAIAPRTNSRAEPRGMRSSGAPNVTTAV